MTTARWVAVASLAYALLQVSGQARAEVYRCSVGGRSVYQDQPCTEATEAPAPKSAGPLSKAPPSSNLKTLYAQMQDAREQSVQLRAAYDRDVQEAKRKAGTMSLDQQRQLTKVMHARWDPKLQAAGRREQELSDWLRKICPGGATLNGQMQQCAK